MFNACACVSCVCAQVRAPCLSKFICVHLSLHPTLIHQIEGCIWEGTGGEGERGGLRTFSLASSSWCSEKSASASDRFCPITCLLSCVSLARSFTHCNNFKGKTFFSVYKGNSNNMVVPSNCHSFLQTYVPFSVTDPCHVTVLYDCHTTLTSPHLYQVTVYCDCHTPLRTCVTSQFDVALIHLSALVSRHNLMWLSHFSALVSRHNLICAVTHLSAPVSSHSLL